MSMKKAAVSLHKSFKGEGKIRRCVGTPRNTNKESCAQEQAQTKAEASSQSTPAFKALPPRVSDSSQQPGEGS